MLLTVLAELLLVYVMAGAAPLLFVFLLAFIIPATAYLFLRAKIWFVLATPLSLGIILLVNFNVIYLLCLPLLVFGVAACVAAAKSGKLYFGVAVMLAATILGLGLPIYAVTAISGKSAGENAAEYVLTRPKDDSIMNMAKNYLFEKLLAEAVTTNPSVSIEELNRETALTVNAMTADEILKEYSLYIEETVNRELLYFIFSTGAMIALTVFLILSLLLTSYQYLLKKYPPPACINKTVYNITAPRHIVMPRRYALYALAPYILIFLLRFAVPIFEILFEATYFGFILAPFGFAGISLAYYLFHRFKINYGYSTLILAPVIILAFAGTVVPFMIFSAIGITDYFLNLRFIIEHYNDPKRRKTK